jgi:hypothetical protein
MRRLFSRICYTAALTLAAFSALSSPLWGQETTAVTAAVQQAKESGVDQEAINQVLVLGYNHELSSQEVVTFMNVLTQAGAENLPVEPLVSKMEEGLAKGAEVPRIEQVVRRELHQYHFVRHLARQALHRWNIPPEKLRDRHLARIAKTLTMGISEQDMKGFFEEAPPASVKAIPNAFEFMAALKQGGINFGTIQEVTFAGLEKGYFSKSGLDLASTLTAAKRGSLPDQEIRTAALDVVQGKKSVQEAQKALGIEAGETKRGPEIVSPRGSASPIEQGKAGEKGGSDTSGHGPAPGAGDGMGGSGGGASGPGGAGSGGGPSGAGGGHR